jgi:hypothetical protein
MHPIQSSNLLSVGYDAKSRTLRIEFSTGAVYVYSDVPNEVYQGLRSAPSVGRYFATNIKNLYSYEREE